MDIGHRGPLARAASALVLALTLNAGVHAQLVADFSATPTSGANQLLVAFTEATTGGTPISWNWNFGDGGSSNNPNPTHLYSTPGTYTVSLTVFGEPPLGFDTEIKQAFITVDPAVVSVNFVATPTTGFGSLDVSFTNTTSGGPVSGWLWDFGDGGSSTEQHPTHLYGVPGTYSVTLTALVGTQQESLAKPGFITVDTAFLPAATVTPSVNNSNGLAVADVDGDGDLDAVSTSSADDEIAWFEQLEDLPPSSPWPKALISAPVDFSNPAAPATGDLDGDARPDIVAGHFGEIAWWRNTGAAFGTRVSITMLVEQPLSIGAVDLDGDGDRDVFSASSNDHKVAWYPNVDGKGGFGPQQVITQLMPVPQNMLAADFDGDGDLDLAASSDSLDVIAWFENTDGAGTFGASQPVPAANPDSVRAGDVDGDGDVDLVAVAGGPLVWMENTDGLGTFGAPQLIDGGSSWETIDLGDVDCDGDVDLLASGDRISWFDNTDGSGSFQPAIQPMLAPDEANISRILVADLDRDGDLDVLASSSSPDRLEWYENVLTPSPWSHLAGGSIGEGGVPALAAKGTLEAGDPLTLSVDDAPAGTLLLAWLSFTSIPLDVLGGTLHANPPSVQILRATDATGAWSQSLTWPAGIPSGVEFWLQFIVQDPSVPAGLTLTNAATATTP